MAEEERFVIIRYLVDKLKDVGKTKIQKLIYFLQNVFGVPLDYIYKMHYYGPYSEELNDDLIDMKSQGSLKIKPDLSGYGYHINVGDEAVDSMESIVKKYKKELDKGMDALEHLNLQQLEIMGTIHFVKYGLDVSEQEEVIETVTQLKPAFTESIIEESYAELESIMGG